MCPQLHPSRRNIFHRLSRPLAVALAFVCVNSLAAASMPRPALAADSHKAVDPSLVELQHAFDFAARAASRSDSLDNAYELLSIADDAQDVGASQIAAAAGAAFADLVKRATADALRNGSNARDTLDQFVDLRAAAYSTSAGQVALDDAMTSLFPVVAGGIEQTLATAATFDARLAALNDLALLQASATQAKMDTIARGLGVAFDAGAADLHKANGEETDQALQQRRAAALRDAQKSREDRISDARANNVDVVAGRMKDAPGESPSAGSRTALGPPKETKQ